MPPKAKACPACGHEHTRRSTREFVEGELVEVAAEVSKLPYYLQDKKAVWPQLVALSMQRKNGDEDAAKKFARRQFEQIYGHWPQLKFQPNDQDVCSAQVKSYVVSRLIKWAKTNQRAA